MSPEYKHSLTRLEPRIKQRFQTVIALALILTFGILLRFSGFGRLPAGLYYDEAVEGLDALEINDGATPVYFTGKNSRAALFTYAVAGSISILGHTPAAIRLPATLAGCGSILGIYLVSQSIFSRRIGLVAAFASTFSVWMLILGRLGDNPAASLLLLSFGLWLGVKGYQSHKWWYWVTSGVLMGLALYTYESVRVMLLVLPIWALLLCVVGRARRLWPGALLFGATLLCIAMPLLIFAFGNWDIVIERSEDVSVLRPEDGYGTVINTVVRQTWATLQMFVSESRGDWNWRQNIAGRPVFDPLMAIPFLISIPLSLRSVVRHRMLFLASWAIAALLVTILTDWAPHFRRASAILPILFIWPAIGLDWLVRKIASHTHQVIAITAVGSIMLGSAFFTTRDFWLERHLERPEIEASFDHPITAIATSVNQFLSIGWQGEGVLATLVNPNPNRQVWIEASVWNENPAIRFLVPIMPEQTPAVQLLQTPALVTAPPLYKELLMVLPKDAPIPRLPDNYLAIIPEREREMIVTIPDSVIVTMEDLPGVTVAHDPNLLLPYRIVGARAWQPMQPFLPAPTLGESLTLLGARLSYEDDNITVVGLWQVVSLLPPPLSISAHLYCPERNFLDGDDALDISPELWRPGLKFLQRHNLIVPPEVETDQCHVLLGLYRLDDGTRYTTPTGADAMRIGMFTVN